MSAAVKNDILLVPTIRVGLKQTALGYKKGGRIEYFFFLKRYNKGKILNKPKQWFVLREQFVTHFFPFVLLIF